MDQHLRALLVGALAGGAFFLCSWWGVQAVVDAGVRAGEHPVLVLLLAAALLHVVLAASLATTTAAAYVALRVLHVPRPLGVAGLATVVLAVALTLSVRTGAGFGEQPYPSIVGFAAVYGLCSVVLAVRR